mmetsp:Transcript_47641/g.103598  ORF Transcript_47641/g.103598 Transcript_47641/m.103598 type:complete len:204 (+) Transcript_47641:1542-2153(+)
MLARESFADGDGLHVADEAGRNGCRHRPRNGREIQVKEAEGNHATGDGAHIVALAQLITQRDDEPQEEYSNNAADERSHGPELRQPLVLARNASVRQEIENPQRAQQQGQTVRLPDVLKNLADRHIHELRLFNVEAKDVLQLAEANDDCSTAREAADNGMSKKGDQKTKPENTRHDLKDPNNCRGEEGKLGILQRTLFGLGLL